MKTKNRPLKKLFLSDIHFGKKTHDITPEIKDCFNRNRVEFRTLDYIIIPGDVFDKHLYGDSSGLLDGVKFMTFISKFCLEFNIKLRWLKGTPSHDRNQQRLLETITDELFDDLDYKFIDTLCIVKETDHTCLYIPDEIRLTTRETYLDSVQLMHDNNIYQLDSIVMHGAFPHSLGFGEVGTTLFDEADMMNLCKGYIVSGHIHTHQSYKRIITPGPVSRQAFGEEEPKGCLLTYEYVNEDTGDNNHFRLIENVKAPRYDTISCTSDNYTDLISELMPILKNTPKGSFIRLLFDVKNPLSVRNNFNDLSTFFTFTHMTVDKKKQIEEKSRIKINTNKIWNKIGINEIVSYMTDRLRQKGMDETQIKSIIGEIS